MTHGPFSIERATRADVPRILEIANWAALHTTANFALEPEPLSEWEASYDKTCVMYPWLVTRVNEEIVAWAKGGPHRPRGAYNHSAEVSVYVDQRYHGQGVGRALYNVLLPLLKAQGYAVLLAGITSPNPASERLHASVGFTRCSMFHRIGYKFDTWLDVGYWELIVRDGDAPPPLLKPVDEVWGG